MSRDVHRALELLEAYHAELFRPSDIELRQSIEKVVGAFKTGLFTALCDIQEFYDSVLLNERISFGQKVSAARRFADRWDSISPIWGTQTESRNTVEIIDVLVDASTAGLGFSITGGIDRDDPHIRVTNITPGGAVASDGRIRVGDIILQVNDVDCSRVPHQRAVQALNDAGALVRLVLKRDRPQRTLSQNHLGPQSPELRPTHRSRSLHQLPQQTQSTLPRPHSRLSGYSGISENPRIVILRKGESGLGFNIVGGESSEPIFVSNVVPGGVADQSGNVHRGDVLLRVNDTPLVGATHSAAAHCLKSIPPHSFVQLQLQYRPHESALFFQKLNQQNSLFRQ